MPKGFPRLDVALAVVLTASGLAEATLGLTGSREPWPVLLTIPVVTGAVAWRRVRIDAAVIAMVAGMLAQALLGSDLPGGFSEPIVLVLVVFSVGAAPSPVPGLILLVGTLASLAGVIALGEDPHMGNFVFLATVVGAAYAAGYAIRLSEERARLIAERRTMQERTRIAAELHDVVSHNITAMVVQAAAERRDQPTQSPAAQALADIEQQGRQTLVELRRMLGVLHVDDDSPLGPQPGIPDIAELVHSSSATGLQVALFAEGAPTPVPEGVSLAAYRVVQEALTNVRKHGGRPEATVTLRWGTGAVEVEVVSQGLARRHSLLPGAGFGLRAMAERVRTYGGTVVAGPAGDGFRVLARLPLEGTG